MRQPFGAGHPEMPRTRLDRSTLLSPPYDLENTYSQHPRWIAVMRSMASEAPTSELARILSHKRSRLIAISLILALIYFTFTRASVRTDPSPPPPTTISQYGTKARKVPAEELLARPLPTDVTTIPKIFHQSWKTAEIPEKMAAWSDNCRMMHPDWEWVQWTNEDNLALVKQYFPSFLKTYEGLSKEIYRADVVRNMYMYIFGGVYADLDLDCLRPMDELFAESTYPKIPRGSSQSQGYRGQKSDKRLALFGRMGTDDKSDQSIPNAWMASSPGHPFFMLPLEFAEEQIEAGSHARVEALTGPGALYGRVKVYQEKYAKGETLDEHLANSPLLAEVQALNSKVEHSVRILPFRYIYPYSWQRDGEAVRDVCWSTRKDFEAAKCKELVATDRWGSYMITYWSHTWDPQH